MIGRRTRYVQFSPALDDSLNGNTRENGRVTAEISRSRQEPRLQVPAAEFISKKGMKSVNNLLDELPRLYISDNLCHYMSLVS
jgi:hypothetical protein